MEYSAGELHRALTLLEGATNKGTAKALLGEYDLPVSGTWDELKDRLRAAVEGQVLPFEQIVATLDRAEEAGHQHVYLYSLSEPARERLEDAGDLRRRIREAELGNVFNQPTRVIPTPDTTTCVAVKHNVGEMSIKWVERRKWREKVGEEQEGDLFTITYRIHEGRAVNLLKASAENGTAELRISEVGKLGHSDYKEKEAELLAAAGWLFEESDLRRIQLFKGIPGIVHSDETRVRAHHYHTREGTQAAFKSSASEVDLRKDEVYQAGEEAVGDHGDPRYLNVYWLPAPGTPLGSELHTYIYADHRGNKVRFSTNCTSGEVDYVLGRIREFAQA